MNLKMEEIFSKLDLKCLYDLVPCGLPEISEHHFNPAGSKAEVVQQETGLPHLHYNRLKAVCSMPDLQRDSLLGTLSDRPQSPLVLLGTKFSQSLEAISVAEDLRRLVEEKTLRRVPDPEADLPPLIRIQTRRQTSELPLPLENLESVTDENERTALKHAHPQAETFSIPLPARVAAPCTSDRILTKVLNVEPSPPVYNHLTGEIEPSSVNWLDRNLCPGEDVKEVIGVLSQSISAEYLNFDEDPLFETAPLDSQCTASSKREHFNPNLRRPRFVRQANRCQYKRVVNVTTERTQQEVLNMCDKPQIGSSTKCKCNFCPEDYLRYISTQDVDFLGVVLDLYDGNEEDSPRRTHTRHWVKKQRRQRQKMENPRNIERQNTTGEWNVNSVLMGGLGKEPPLEEDTNSKDGLPPSRSQTAVTPTSKNTCSDGTAKSCHLQARLEQMWDILHFSETQRINMAIKYSSQAYRGHLQEATTAWENASQLIQKREMLLSQMELFEREASDPSRFFQPGYRGTSMARMNESRQRERLNKQMLLLEKPLIQDIRHIWNCFHDTVTYNGRPYQQKMQRDRSEMLYRLQDERHKRTLEQLVASIESSLVKLPSLDILPTNSDSQSYRLSAEQTQAIGPSQQFYAE